MKRIISYNVNGIRAALKKDFMTWLGAANPDVLCLQEIKAMPEQLEADFLENLEYHHYWYPAQKKGYSGTAIWTKEEPKHVEYGCGMEKYDFEGRVIRVDFETFSVMSVYMPSGSNELRQSFKMEWLSDFQDYINELKKEIPNLIISGDYNICHLDIDIHNPTKQQRTSGFLPEERQWVSKFIESGFIDTFRHFNMEPNNYSWWSYRAGARGKNLGWRIDYHMVSEPLRERISRATILPEAKHSDHCPIVVELQE
ncbi:MAG: exodeoxyribonuclease III [Vicingaceae bacterium]|mgnify:FL=1|jgi:exodeoxyribonuclease-3|tara:strand:+ start:1499 stop:2263 length:765 start_codon:yes stop_codon:yes gene_type:complete